MDNGTRAVIDSIVAGTMPVRPMRKRAGLTWVAVAFAATVLVVLVMLGARRGLMDGEFSVFFVVANGLILLLGLACTGAVIAMASPRVGAEHDGPKWAMIMAAVLPVAGLVALAGDGPAVPFDDEGPLCMALGLLAALLVGGALFGWLRRGAPVATERAGLFLGTAAGALGTFAYGLACPFDSVEHLGVWHAAPVIVAALIGRFVIARRLRW